MKRIFGKGAPLQYIYARIAAAKPPTEIHAFSKYSFTVGTYPLENHHASSRCALQNFARCNENIRQGTPIGQLRNIVLLIAFVRYISVTLIYSIRNHILILTSKLSVRCTDNVVMFLCKFDFGKYYTYIIAYLL